MARLLTRDDKNHRHAILGLLSLLHFLYRLSLVGLTGDAFPARERPAFTLLSLAPHALLHLTSLTLHLPKRRNFSAPMIWPEFRLHSACFAARTLLATCASLWLFEPGQGARHPASYALVLGTCAMADLITKYVGDRDQRTTNAMPYAPQATEDNVRLTKMLYRDAQVHATLLAATGHPTLTFLSLIGIQLAPLLMTLVRKGIANSTHYHRYYSLALIVPYVAMVRRGGAGLPVPGPSYQLAWFAFYFGRFHLRANKYALWTGAMLLQACLSPALDAAAQDSVAAQPVLLVMYSLTLLKNVWRTRWTFWPEKATTKPPPCPDPTPAAAPAIAANKIAG